MVASQDITTIKVSRRVKEKLDELSEHSWPNHDKTYDQIVEELVKTATLVWGIDMEHTAKSHPEVARVAIEKASNVRPILREILDRPLIDVTRYDYASTYHCTVDKPLTEKRVLQFDQTKVKRPECETKLYLVQGSPNKGVIEVIRHGEKYVGPTWIVKYMGLGSFEVNIYEKRQTKSQNATPRGSNP